MNTIKAISYILGGLAIFLYGMRVCSEGLQKTAGHQLRVLLNFFTHNKFVALIVGIIVTICLQSSSATTVMLVGFVNSGLMKLAQTLGVILGASIGTTVTVQLIACNVADYSLLLIAAGFLVSSVSRYERGRYFGKVLIGFGFIFLGMLLLKNGVAPFEDNPFFKRFLLSSGVHPIAGVVVAALFTSVIQSSAATIAVGLALTSQGLMGSGQEEILINTIPIILGAQVGTCTTALLSSIGTSPEARKVALSHLLLKIAGVVLFLPWIAPFSRLTISLTEMLGGGHLSEQRLMANAHTLISIISSLLLIHTTGLVVWILGKVGPKESYPQEELRLRRLDRELTRDNATFAVAEANKEVERMGMITLEMLYRVVPVFQRGEHRELEDLRRMDDKLDRYNYAIKKFLTRLSRMHLTIDESMEEIRLLYIIDSFEHIGDIISKDLMTMAQKMVEEDLEFTIEGFHDIATLHGKVASQLKKALDAFEKNDRILARSVIDEGKAIQSLKQNMHFSHIDRLHKGLRESLNTSSIHLDILAAFEQVHNYTMNIARVIEEKRANS